VPALREIRPGRQSRCHFAETLDLQGMTNEPAPALVPN
jgi:hypothetical protein